MVFDYLLKTKKEISNFRIYMQLFEISFSILKKKKKIQKTFSKMKKQMTFFTSKDNTLRI